MKTFRDHCRDDIHRAAAQAEIRRAKIHKAAMAEEEEGSSRHEFHKAMLADHTAEAERHLECCKNLPGAMKAESAEFGKLAEMIPDGVSAVVPNAPPSIRPVLRAGQRDWMAADAPVELALEKVFGSD